MALAECYALPSVSPGGEACAGGVRGQKADLLGKATSQQSKCEARQLPELQISQDVLQGSLGVGHRERSRSRLS